jgi:NitT/TauT family transport system substrate-binding protein
MKTCRRSLPLVALLACVVVAACGGAQPSGTRPLHGLTAGLTYIPNIQFAPFYAADSLGYYRDAGLQVTLRHHSFSEDEFGAIASGKEDVIFAGGDEMLQARDHSVSLVDVATIFQKYPVALIVPDSSPIRAPADIRGHSIGTPGPYGETYFGLLSLLQFAGLAKSDVNTQFIQFTQVAALAGHKVDGVMGYLNNENIQLRQAGVAVRTLALSDVVQSLPLVSNGLSVLDTELKSHPDDVRSFVAATLRGVQYVEQHPDRAVELSKKYVPGLDQAKDAANARAVLDATLPLWKSSGRAGQNSAKTWQDMARFMASYGLLSKPLDVSGAFSNQYLP